MSFLSKAVISYLVAGGGAVGIYALANGGFGDIESELIVEIGDDAVVEISDGAVEEELPKVQAVTSARSVETSIPAQETTETITSKTETAPKETKKEVKSASPRSARPRTIVRGRGGNRPVTYSDIARAIKTQNPNLSRWLLSGKIRRYQG